MNIDDIRDSLVTCHQLLISPPQYHIQRESTDQMEPYKVFHAVREVELRLKECIDHFNTAVETAVAEQVSKQVKEDD